MFLIDTSIFNILQIVLFFFLDIILCTLDIISYQIRLEGFH
jgi:hypothetical protein